VEERTREKLREEKKKHQEVVKKVERERRIVLDNYETRRELLEKDLVALKQESECLKIHIDKESKEIEDAKRKQSEVEEELSKVQRSQAEAFKIFENVKKEANEEKLKNLNMINHLGSQIKMLRTCDDRADKEVVVARELEVELKMLQKENEKLLAKKHMLESKLSAPDTVRYLVLNEPSQKSFAEEVCELPENELRKSLDDQKSLTIELHGYIDSVLVNIMENFPHLLEILK